MTFVGVPIDFYTWMIQLKRLEHHYIRTAQMGEYQIGMVEVPISIPSGGKFAFPSQALNSDIDNIV